MKNERRWNVVDVVRQVTDAETDDNDDHRSDDVHLTRVFLLSTMSRLTSCLDTAAGRCWCRGVDAHLSADNADDAVVGEEEKRWRQNVVPDKHRQRVAAEHRRSQTHKSQALTVDQRHCRPGRDEVAADRAGLSQYATYAAA